MMFNLSSSPNQSGTGATRLQRSRVAQHGTAERIFPMDLGGGRAHHRERDRERRPRFTGVQPPGPQTASEWFNALEDIFERIRAINSSLASHVHAEGAADGGTPANPGGRDCRRPPDLGGRRAISGVPRSAGPRHEGRVPSPEQ